MILILNIKITKIIILVIVIELIDEPRSLLLIIIINIHIIIQVKTNHEKQVVKYDI